MDVGTIANERQEIEVSKTSNALAMRREVSETKNTSREKQREMRLLPVPVDAKSGARATRIQVAIT